jgi:hypothetical protein
MQSQQLTHKAQNNHITVFHAGTTYTIVDKIHYDLHKKINSYSGYGK